MRNNDLGKCLLPELLVKFKSSSTELSDKTGMSVQQLSKYLNDKSDMSLRTARIISGALGCSIDDLYQWKI